MFARSLTVLLAATAIAAWPIAFFHTNNCQSEPVLVLHEPPMPGSCSIFYGHPPVKSYSGGTQDKVQKLLIYYDRDLCHRDAAHRAYSNHTINNNANACIPFKKNEEVPMAFSFIEEILPVKVPHNMSASCNKLVVQT
ncbi:hypothetical protein JB92DRAFT_2954139 [Gautieria morchelliformis]|nr:hypothetical protein JB92DRAFT_2954139 [Gautieria morchelliformis]